MSIDWLLSESEPEEERAQEAEKTVLPVSSSWVDVVPGVIGRLLRQHGWLFGVYIAITGLGLTVMGALAKILTRSMFSMDNNMFGGGTIWYDELGNRIGDPIGETFPGFAVNNPVSTMGTAMIVIGLVLITAGIVLAVMLKKRSKQ
ncbi:MAG: hypothetical protein PHQ85_06180 [Eubacteriales bacterium]|nr:hypothetical protein [Eubacteriales bacterium]MDD4105586.1 hypothetical protein [Eubacteriales bacterium]MDD4710838.1 hypothetical protein [Eubacteriales bacterium]NLO16153.1 hypothetical protein [Clostridiales bacterium]